MGSNIIEDGELAESAVVANFATTADGKNYNVNYYNLDVILAVGYRVKSPRGVHFRRWGTTTLHEYLVKGFVMDDDKLGKFSLTVRTVRAGDTAGFGGPRNAGTTYVDV